MWFAKIQNISSAKANALDRFMYHLTFNMLIESEPDTWDMLLVTSRLKGA